MFKTNEKRNIRPRIKIVRIITRLNVGGPAQQAIALNSMLPKERFNCVLLTGSLDQGEAEFDDMMGALGRVVVVPSLRRPVHLFHDAIAFLQILRILLREKPQLIHTHMAKAGSLGRIAGLVYKIVHPRSRVILIHTFHGHVLHSYFSKMTTQIYISIEKWLARHTDRLFAVSKTIKNELLELGIGRPSQYHIVPVGLKLTDLLQVIDSKTCNNYFRIGMVGRLVPVKNHRLFFNAIKRVSEGKPEISLRCEIIGDGELRSDLERQVKQSGLKDIVNFHGWRFDLPKIYEALDCVCLTSLNEGTPLSVIEAMAAGRPVIATDVGGVRDLLGLSVDDGTHPSFRVMERGVLIDSQDVNALRDALLFLSTRPELRKRIGCAGRDHVQSRFTIKRLLTNIQSLYDELLDKNF